MQLIYQQIPLIIFQKYIPSPPISHQICYCHLNPSHYLQLLALKIITASTFASYCLVYFPQNIQIISLKYKPQCHAHSGNPSLIFHFLLFTFIIYPLLLEYNFLENKHFLSYFLLYPQFIEHMVGVQQLMVFVEKMNLISDLFTMCKHFRCIFAFNLQQDMRSTTMISRLYRNIGFIN